MKYDWLMKINGNEENLDDFISRFQNNQNDFVCFLGAGLPSMVKGMYDAKGLAISLNKEYGKRYKYKDDLSNHSSKIYKSLEEKEKAGFYKKVFKKVKVLESIGTHHELVKIFSWFVTINYDDPIEEAYKSVHKKELKRYYFSFPNGVVEDEGIVYLHGHDDIGFGILRKEDYKYFYSFLDGRFLGIPTMLNSYEYLFTKKHLVLCSTSFENNIRDTFEYLNASIKKGTKKEHFWIVGKNAWEKCILSSLGQPENDKEKKEYKEYFQKGIGGFFQKYNIKPIIYTDASNHQALKLLCGSVNYAIGTKLEEPKEEGKSRV